MNFNLRKCCARKGGFTLLEVMLALAIFILAGVSLVIALNRIFDVAVETDQIDRMRVDLSTRLAESRLIRLAPGSESLAPGYNNITYKKTIEPLILTNLDGQPLANLYRVRITAYSKIDNDVEQRSVEVYVYQP